MEIWQQIDGYPDYQISNLGRVKSFKWGKEKILNPFTNSHGYKNIRLSLNGVSKVSKVHRLVALAFIPNPENHRIINHIDGDKCNNNVANLQWTTPSENTQHAFDTGLHTGKGKNHYRHNPKIFKFFNPKLGVFEECTQHDLVKKYNVNKDNLPGLIRGIYKSCNGWFLVG